MDNNLRLILCLLVVLCGTFIIAFRWKRIEDRKKIRGIITIITISNRERK